MPDVLIGDLQPARNVGLGHSSGGVTRYSGNTQAPQQDKSNPGQDLKLNRAVSQHGMGVHAPCELQYDLKPEYKRFVALAGADEYLLSINNGVNLAKYQQLLFDAQTERFTNSAEANKLVTKPYRDKYSIPEKV